MPSGDAAGHRGDIVADDGLLHLSELVLFEIPIEADIDRFCAGLRPRWPGWSRADEDVWLIAAKLGPKKNDLAALLRRAQALLSELELGPISFCVDDRLYVLEPATVEAERAA